MKQFKFLAVALAALTIVSCSKENITDNPGNNAPGSKAAVTVNFANPGGTKAVGRPDDTDDAKIVDYNIFLFRDGGELDGKVHGVDPNVSTTTGVTVQGTTSAKRVYVVANAGDLTGTISSENALKDKLVQLTKKTDGTGDASQTKGQVWMSGDGLVAFDPGATNAAVPVVLKFVGAKLSVTVDYAGVKKNGGGEYGTDYKINRVFVMNAGGVSKLFGTSLIPTKDELIKAKVAPYFVSGLTTDNRTPAWTNMAKTYGLSTSLVTEFAEVAADKGAAAVAAGAHFYVFEQNAATSHQEEEIATIVVVEATWMSSSPANKTVYFPIKFKITDAKYTIERGNAYEINISLNGNFKDPGNGGNGGGGTEDPGEDLIASKVTVTVTPATWTGVPVEKIFN